MIPLTNYDFQWGRSEVVIIYPDIVIKFAEQGLDRDGFWETAPLHIRWGHGLWSPTRLWSSLRNMGHQNRAPQKKVVNIGLVWGNDG